MSAGLGNRLNETGADLRAQLVERFPRHVLHILRCGDAIQYGFTIHHILFSTF